MFSAVPFAAQESTPTDDATNKSIYLRLKPSPGDMYQVRVEQTSNMGTMGGSNMTMAMDIMFTDVINDKIQSTSNIRLIKMDMNQSGITMSFDSTKENEELDATSQMIKNQMAPMLETTIYNTMNNLGETLETKSVPPVAGIDQYANKQDFTYPKDKISLGSSWSADTENNGLNMSITYTVKEMNSSTVFVSMSGLISGISDGKINGTAEIDVKTGIQKKLELEMKMSTSGVNVSAKTVSTWTKM